MNLTLYQSILDAAVARVEKSFQKVHPLVGDNYKCATGEPYIAYSFRSKEPELLIEIAKTILHLLAQGTPRFLYWRARPELAREDEKILLYFRCCASSEWAERGQHWKELSDD